jgi:hypothetical protein
MSINRIRLALKCLMHWTPPLGRPISDLCDKREVLLIGMGFSANDPRDQCRCPGSSNEAIADAIIRILTVAKTRDIKVHVLAQREVAEALYVRGAAVDHVLKGIQGEWHVDSVEILGQAWVYGCKHEITDAILVAHKRHLLRCAWTARLWGFTILFPHIQVTVYAPESKQWWTRGPLRFFVGDLYGRISLVVHGYDCIKQTKSTLNTFNGSRKR